MTTQFRMPVCLLVEPSTIGEISAIYPFDSGAFNAGMFSRYTHPDMALADFLLGNTLDISPKIVSLFFGDNKKYLYGKCSNSMKFHYSEMVPVAYNNIINSKSDEDFDDRRYTIEVKKSGSVSVVQLRIVAVVISSTAMDDPTIYDTIVNGWNAFPIMYDEVPGAKPSDYQTQLLEKVTSYYNGRGLL